MILAIVTTSRITKAVGGPEALWIVPVYERRWAPDAFGPKTTQSAIRTIASYVPITQRIILILSQVRLRLDQCSNPK